MSQSKKVFIILVALLGDLQFYLLYKLIYSASISETFVTLESLRPEIGPISAAILATMGLVIFFFYLINFFFYWKFWQEKEYARKYLFILLLLGPLTLIMELSQIWNMSFFLFSFCAILSAAQGRGAWLLSRTNFSPN